MTGRQCDCAERTHGGFVFTCPVCVTLVMRSVAYRALTAVEESVRLDRSGSVSGLVEVEDG